MVGAELLLACSVLVDKPTLKALIETESSFNPYSIAIVNDKPLKKQPRSLVEAEKIIEELEKRNVNYSVGLGQVNKTNFSRYNVTGKELLDPCLNIRISEKILSACFTNSPNHSVSEALSCYYAGNYSYGFVKEKIVNEYTAYIERVIKNYSDIKNKDIIVPSIKDEIKSALNKVRVPRKRISNKSGVLVRNSQIYFSEKEKNFRKIKNFHFSKSGVLIKNISINLYEN